MARQPERRLQIDEGFVPDDVDRAIIDQLRRDGRASNQQVAKHLGLTAATVSIRIRRMEAANRLRVVTVSDFSAHGIDILMALAIEVHGRPVLDVANDLLVFPEVFALHLVSGPHEIDVLLALKSYQEATDLALNKLSGIKGIRSIEPAIAVDVLKYKFDVTPIHEVGSPS